MAIFFWKLLLEGTAVWGLGGCLWARSRMRQFLSDNNIWECMKLRLLCRFLMIVFSFLKIMSFWPLRCRKKPRISCTDIFMLLKMGKYSSAEELAGCKKPQNCVFVSIIKNYVFLDLTVLAWVGTTYNFSQLEIKKRVVVLAARPHTRS